MIRTILAVSMLALASPAWAADAAKEPTPEEAVASFRADLMAKRSDVMAKSLTLTSEQAAKFWPLFEEFQKEQSVIVDEQMKAIKQYGERLQELSDSDALAYVKSLLARDARMNELRAQWLTKFQTVVPAKTAARAIQIDRRLGQVTQVGLSSQIPLVR
jgi:Spy/CpxP family protein refolding chaperone